MVRLPEEEDEQVQSIRVIDEGTGARVTDAKALFDLLSGRSGNAGHARRAPGGCGGDLRQCTSLEGQDLLGAWM